MKVKVAISAHHLHLTKEDYYSLFGDETIHNVQNIKQPGEFRSDKVVTIKNNDREINNVRLVGPIRNYTQVELSKTEYIKLKINNAPIRQSGNLEDAATLTLIGPKGEITKKCGIIAERHIHVTKEMKEAFHLPDRVQVFFPNNRGGIMKDVIVKVKPTAFFELHLDTDEANAFNLENGDEGIIIMEKKL